MLTHLQIQNFTLVEYLELDFNTGLTTITGETGAGKSILLGAIGLALGERADSDKVRFGAERAELQATFDIGSIPLALDWLKKQSLDSEEQCILRRVITKEGRSRAYINGRSVTRQQLKTLSQQLLHIHGQHAHQSLLSTENHRELLDRFHGKTQECTRVFAAFNEWHQINKALEKARNISDAENARLQLLRYQVEELDNLALQDGELSELEARQRTLETLRQNQTHRQQVQFIFNDEQNGILEKLHIALHLIDDLPEKTGAMTEAHALLKDALIAVQEADNSLTLETSDESEIAALPEIEQRLDAIYTIARKHRVQPSALSDLHAGLSEELDGMLNKDEKIAALEEQRQQAYTIYEHTADQLSATRRTAAQTLEEQINSTLRDLGMSHSNLHIAFASTPAPSPYGHDHIELLIRSGKDRPHLALTKVASGGELSRVSLAIQVATAQSMETPSLVFDEVDVGIGGATGHEVGRLLRKLGEKTQVICVTHLAQVASKSNNHLLVLKSPLCATNTSIKPLSSKEKVSEIARMMGGDPHAKSLQKHARQMLKMA